MKNVQYLGESRVFNALVLYQFIKKLTTPFTKTKAYQLGIIDERGNVLKRRKDLKTQEERDAFGVFDVLVLNIKKIIERHPFGKSRLATYAAALWLIKEGNFQETDSDLLYESFHDFMDVARGNPKEFERAIFEIKRILDSVEEEITNTVGSGNIAGTGHDGDDPVVRRKKKKKREEEEV